MEENISERNGFVRLALGTGLTACGIAHLAKESGNRGIGALFVAAGAMKVAEGIFLYCPLKGLINSNVKQAVVSTFDEYLDGESIMHAYNEFYTDKWSGGKNAGFGAASASSSASQSYSGSSASSNATAGSKAGAGHKNSQGNSSGGKNLEEVASEIGQMISSTTSNNSMKDAVNKAVKTAASSNSNKTK